MPSCIVPGCTSGYKTNPGKFHFFTIPKDSASLELWKRAVKRENAKSGHPVCENHFAKDKILWQRQILGVDGCVLAVSPYKIPRLVKGTVPSIFPWVEEDISPKTTTSLQSHKDSVFQPQSVKLEDNFADDTDGCLLPQKQLRVDDGNKENNNTTIPSLLKLHQRELECHENQDPLDCQKNRDQTNSNETTPVIVSIEEENISSNSLTFDKLLETEIKLPPEWLMQKTTCEGTRLITLLTTRCRNLEKGYKTFVLKAVTVTDDLSIQVTVLDKLLTPSKLNFFDRLTNTTELEELLRTIDTMNVCKGCSAFISSTIETQIKNVSKDITETWRHNECSLLLPNIKSCKSCRTAQKSLASKLRRWKSETNKIKRNSHQTCPAQKKEFIRLGEKLLAAKVSKVKAREKYKSLQGQLKIRQTRMTRCADLEPDKLLKSGKFIP